MKVIKANRALLKKSKSFKDLRKDYINYSQTTKLQFKKLTEVERKKVRAKIIAQAKKDRIEEIGLYLISLVFGIFYFLYYYLF
ncbi:hypothetical protein [uncultured Maribacter sp.]|uniref:hypothetical protein n=1 Tax=uncultured Maribacter sp. TaxID=431308 RepID=UPI0030DD5FCA